MLSNRYFLLTMADHGLVAREREMHGRHVPRCLNAVGRWANAGKRVPLLVWTDQEGAMRAAAIATAARKKQVTVTVRADSSWRLGREICVFTEVHAPALIGYVD